MRSVDSHDRSTENTLSNTYILSRHHGLPIIGQDAGSSSQGSKATDRSIMVFGISV